MTGVLTRNLRFMSAGVVGVALVQYALYFLVARYLGASGYGDLAIALTMALLAAPICDLGMNVSVIWTYTRAPDRLPAVLGASLCIRLGLAVPVGLAAMAVGWALGYDSAVLALFPPLFLAAVLDGVSGLCSAVFQARERMGYSAAIMLSRNATKAAAFTAVLCLGGDLMALAYSFLIAALACAVLWGRVLLRHTTIRFDRAELTPVLRTAWPFGSAIIANLLLLQSDILMLGVFSDEAEVGVYHAAFRFLVLAELIPQIVSNVVMPRSYRMGHRDGVQAVSRFYRSQATVLGSVGVLGSITLALLGDSIAHWTLGPEFAGSGVLLIALAPLVFMRFMAVPLGDVLASLGQQPMLSRATWLACGLNVVLNLVLVPTYGALGAALATVASQLAILLLLTVFGRAAQLDTRWPRALGHAIVVAGATAAAFHTIPDAPALLVGTAVLAFWGLFRTVPTREHLRLRAHSPLLARLGGSAPTSAKPIELALAGVEPDEADDEVQRVDGQSLDQQRAPLISTNP